MDILFGACYDGDLERVKDSLARTFHVSNTCNYGFRVASEKGYTEIVKVLLDDSRVDPSCFDNEPIRIASTNGHEEIVKLLLRDPRVDPSTWNNFPIQYASLHHHIDIVQLLLDDPRVDPSDAENCAIKYAIINEKEDIVSILLRDDRVFDKREFLGTRDRKYIKDLELRLMKKVFLATNHILPMELQKRIKDFL